MATPADDHDVQLLVEEHARRCRALDPLLPATTTMLPADTGGQLLTVGDAVGLATTDVLDPAGEGALWGPTRQHRLRARAGGLDPGAGLYALLTAWDRVLVDVAEPGDVDSAATVMWPSRDTTVVRALVLHGFAPLTVVAARPRSRSASQHADAPDVREVRVRQAGEGDLDQLATWAQELHTFDARFGVVTERPGSREVLTQALTAQWHHDPSWTWVAERAGRPVGFAQVQPPEQAAWVAPLAGAGSVAYFGYQYVEAGERGAGVGAALAGQAHRRLDEAGIAVTLLHHALASPLSTPFWARQGYRPLWTAWQRRPVVPTVTGRGAS